MLCREQDKRVVLILVDGMRPDAVEKIRHPFVEELRGESFFRMDGKTVMPSITLPCHMSLFHSVPPERHGTLTNVYVPQARPIKGIFESLTDQGKVCASIYNWEELRDLGRPGSLQYSFFINEYHYEQTDAIVTQEAIDCISQHKPDFMFVYLGVTDTVGHDYGWMTEKYMDSVYKAWDCIEQLVKTWGQEYTFIITADHGGHGRNHGENIPEDMTIPVIITGKDSEKAEKGTIEPSILDIAPTIAELVGTKPEKAWEGKSLLKKANQGTYMFS